MSRLSNAPSGAKRWRTGLVAGLGMSALLAGCVVVTTSPPQANPVPAGARSGAVSVAQSQQFQAYLNAFRNARGLSQLSPSPWLERAAQSHANDMASNGFFDHTGSDGSSVGDRATRSGYGWCLVAENIALGQRDEAEVMQGWIDSPGHNANMALEDITEFGFAQAPGSAPGTLWVLVLGRPC